MKCSYIHLSYNCSFSCHAAALIIYSVEIVEKQISLGIVDISSYTMVQPNHSNLMLNEDSGLCRCQTRQ